MADEDPIERMFSSTTWEWRRVKIRRPPEGTGTARRSRSSWRLRSPWDRREKITLKVLYLGGPECRYMIEARGLRGYFSGAICLEDVMSRIYNDQR